MRAWRKLSTKGKKRQIIYAARDFFVRTIWGGYMRGGVLGAYHWVRCHVWNRYHIVNLSKHSDGYRWGWIDRDWAMCLACFNLLCDFVENEDPKIGTRTLDSYRPSWWEADAQWHPVEKETIELQIAADAEIRALYQWWKTERKAEHAAAGYDYKVREALDAKDEEMLQRLMKVRTRLWT